MRQSLHAHVIYLENMMQDVKNRLTQRSLTPEETEDLQLQLTLAESALEHYRQAYALELSASGGAPPDADAGANSGGKAQGADNSSPKRREGLVAIAALVDRRPGGLSSRHSGAAWPSAGLALRARLS